MSRLWRVRSAWHQQGGFYSCSKQSCRRSNVNRQVSCLVFPAADWKVWSLWWTMGYKKPECRYIYQLLVYCTAMIWSLMPLHTYCETSPLHTSTCVNMLVHKLYRLKKWNCSLPIIATIAYSFMIMPHFKTVRVWIQWSQDRLPRLRLINYS